MTRTRGRSAELRQAKQAVRAAHGPLFRIAAQARACGLLSDAELVEFQSLIKAGGDQKLGVVADARDILARYLGRTAELKALLEAHGHSVTEADVVESDDTAYADPAVNAQATSKRSGPQTHPRPRAEEKSLAELSAEKLEERGTRLRSPWRWSTVAPPGKR